MSKCEFKYSKFFDPRKYRYLILFIVFVLLGQDLLLELPVLFHKLQAVRFKGEATGKIAQIVPKKIIRQTLSGSRFITTGYHVTFVFKVDNKEYKGSTFVPNGTTQYTSTYKHLFNSTTIRVKYELENPNKNTVELPYEDTFLSM